MNTTEAKRITNIAKLRGWIRTPQAASDLVNRGIAMGWIVPPKRRQYVKSTQVAVNAGVRNLFGKS